MKQVYHLIIGCALLGGAIFGHTNSLQAQGTKKPIPTIRLGAEWSQLESCLVPKELNVTEIRDETLIHKLNHKVIDENGVEWLTDGKAFFREDLDKGIIYIRYQTDRVTTPEMVLFDYNLNIGDTVNIFDMLGCNAVELLKGDKADPHFKENYRPIITQIQTRNIAGKERRVYTLSQDLGFIGWKGPDNGDIHQWEYERTPIEWIEGIGYNFGFVYWKSLALCGCTKWTLRAICYTSPEGEIIHLLPNFNECMIKGTRSIEARPEAISVKVMRAGDSLILTAEDGATHRLMVYSMEGMQLIPEETFVGSYRLPISRCAEEGQTILLRIDNHSVPYIL